MTTKQGTLRIIPEDRPTNKGLIRSKNNINILRIDTIDSPELFWEPVQVIVTCDDKVEAGDKVLYKNLNQIREVITVEEYINRSIFDIRKKYSNKWCTVPAANNTKFHYKILVRSFQISPKTIQLIVEGELKDGDKVEVEIEQTKEFQEKYSNGNHKGIATLVEKVKLNNGFSIIHPVSNKQAEDILPKEEKFQKEQIGSLKNETKRIQSTLINHHKALESLEERVKQLEEELLAEIKLRLQREKECAEEFEEKRKLKEENTQLKKCLKEVYKILSQWK